MPRLPRITAGQFVRALQRVGWYSSRQVGSHLVLRHDGQPTRRVVVPMHTGKILRPGLPSDLLKDAGLTVEELERLL